MARVNAAPKQLRAVLAGFDWGTQFVNAGWQDSLREPPKYGITTGQALQLCTLATQHLGQGMLHCFIGADGEGVGWDLTAPQAEVLAAPPAHRFGEWQVRVGTHQGLHWLVLTQLGEGLGETFMVVRKRDAAAWCKLWPALKKASEHNHPPTYDPSYYPED